MDLFTVHESPQACVARLRGQQLTIHDTDSFLLAMSDVIEQRPSSHFVLDMKDIRFVDSSAVAAVAQLFKHAVRTGGNLSLACLQPQVQSMFSMSRLSAVIEVNDMAAGASPVAESAI